LFPDQFQLFFPFYNNLKIFILIRGTYHDISEHIPSSPLKNIYYIELAMIMPLKFLGYFMTKRQNI
jgi:hypothetical protein